MAGGGGNGSCGGVGGPFIRTARLDLRKYAVHPALGSALFDYVLYVGACPFSPTHLLLFPVAFVCF